MIQKYYARRIKDKALTDWQSLGEYQKNIAEMASSFSNDFSAGD